MEEEEEGLQRNKGRELDEERTGRRGVGCSKGVYERERGRCREENDARKRRGVGDVIVKRMTCVSLPRRR